MNYKIYKYNVGDSVRIREDFDKHRFLYDPGIVYLMLEYKKKECTVQDRWDSLGNRINYKLNEIPCAWDEEWLEPVYDPMEGVNIDEEEINNLLIE